MIDQPKPKTGEWTAAKILSVYQSECWETRLADAHNAALAAERENYVTQREDWISEIQQLRSQRDEAIRLLHYKDEAHKPLVELLGKIRAQAYWRKEIDAALAKAKEGKAKV